MAIAAGGCLLAGCATQAPERAEVGIDGAVRVDAGRLPFVRTVDERFQSFQIGFSHLTGGETWKSYDDLPKDKQAANLASIREARAPADLADPRLRALTAALAPLYIRYSGTTANSVYFQDNDERPAKPPAGYTVVLTRERWKAGIDFADAVGAKIITSFTNSPGVRDASGAWTPVTAEPWLAYTRSIGGKIYAAELFNEPNAPEPGIAPTGHTAEEFGRDFARFRSFMAKAAPEVKLVGPGVATLGIPVASLDRVSPEDYARSLDGGKFDIWSYHFYPALAQRCAPADSPAGMSADRALSEAWLARPDVQVQRQKAFRDRYAPSAPIWLTETGGAACGGLTWQPTFLDAFRYVDTQARSAKLGVDAMFTHALISGSNGVIDEKTFQPNASYWAAVLWRRLMGAKVLEAGQARSRLHVYGHCLRGKAGGVALIAMNLGQAPAGVDVGGPADLYALTAPELQGKTVHLNGQPLALGLDNTLPSMTPVKVRSGNISLAPTSIAFIALPGARNRACVG